MTAQSQNTSGAPYLSMAFDGDSERPRFDPGARLDQFVVEEFVGGGGLGDVYRAKDTLRDRTVALKLVPLSEGRADRLMEQIKLEADIYDAIKDHRHVLKTFGFHRISWGGLDVAALAMEYADGGSFRDWLRRRRDDVDRRRGEGLGHFKQICRGAAACHAVGCAHLDLKPENALLVGGDWKVSDFGVSPSGEGQGSVGTPAYMSPEHFDARGRRDLDARCDVYSLGVMLHELLSVGGSPPFRGSYERLRDCHARFRPPDLEGVGDTELRVVARCLSKDPADRYASAAELIEDMEGRLDSGYMAEETEALWGQIVDLVASTRLDEAMRECKRLLARAPGHRPAQELLADLRRRHAQAEDLYETMDRQVDSKNLRELLGLLLEATGIYPGHPAGHAVQARLEVRAREYRKAMIEGMAALRRGDWPWALQWFQRARSLNPGASEAEKPVRYVSGVLSHVQERRKTIDRAIASGRRSRAMSLAQELDAYREAMRNPNTTHPGGRPS